MYGPDETFVMGKAKQLRAGADLSIIACGEMLAHAKEAAETLERDGCSVRVIDMFTLKPFDVEAVIAAAQETGRIITVEEHSVNGGLGELVAHITAEHCPVPVKILGFPDEEYMVGKSAELFAYYGLNREGIVKTARGLLG
jgi:transketolase